MKGFKLIHGDIREVIKKLPKYHQIVTSPPYWNQRSYGGDGEMGGEQSPERYVFELAETISLLVKKMHDNGTLFLNMGDKFHDGCQLGLPWRVVLSLISKGMVLKNELIWHKKRIMPQSAKNRFTCSHEHIFFLTKKPKGYTFNHEPVMEEALWKNDPRAGKGPIRYQERREASGAGHTAPVVIKDKRLCRSVWEFQTRQRTTKHFATFPIGIPERCILAGSNRGDTVLDPFAGTCTTGLAALRNGRKFVGVDSNGEFIADATKYLTKELE